MVITGAMAQYKISRIRFTGRSFCLLIRLLIPSNLVTPARFLLIHLIDGKMTVLHANIKNLHIELASAMADLNLLSDRVVGVQALELLVHVYCTQFKNLGFGPEERKTKIHVYCTHSISYFNNIIFKILFDGICLCIDRIY